MKTVSVTLIHFYGPNKDNDNIFELLNNCNALTNDEHNFIFRETSIQLFIVY